MHFSPHQMEAEQTAIEHFSAHQLHHNPGEGNIHLCALSYYSRAKSCFYCFKFWDLREQSPPLFSKGKLFGKKSGCLDAFLIT